MPRYSRPESPCELCDRKTKLQFHHLIPRKVHRRARFRKNFSREELARGVYLCRQCHRAIHRFYDEMTLAQQFRSLAALAGDERLRLHIKWVRKQRIAHPD